MSALAGQTVLVVDPTGKLATAVRPWATVLDVEQPADAVGLARARCPAVVVVHSAVPPEGAIPLLARLAPLAIPSVLGLARDGDVDLGAALRVGTRVVVGVDDGPELIRHALEAARSGELFASPRLAARLLDLVAEGPGDRHPFPSLSARERDVLALLAAGADAPRIADRLGLTPKTVRNHLACIQRKLGARDRVQTAMLARGAGLGPGSIAPRR